MKSTTPPQRASERWSRLLLDEPPLQVQPGLARLIGLTESIVVQQVHYWLHKNLRKKHNIRHGHVWTHNTYEEWGETFPFWSERTIRRTFNKLEKPEWGPSQQPLLISSRAPNTKFYRIDYDVLDALLGAAEDELDDEGGF